MSRGDGDRSIASGGPPDPLVTEHDQLLLHSVDQGFQAVAVESQTLPDGIAQDRADHRSNGQADSQEEDDLPDVALLDRRREYVVEVGSQLLSQEESGRRPIVGVLLRGGGGDAPQALRPTSQGGPPG